MSYRKDLIVSEIMIAFKIWIQNMKGLEKPFKIHEFSRKSDKYWGSCACFSELLKKSEKSEKKSEKKREKSEKSKKKSEKSEKKARKARKLLFSYFCLKLPKKLLSRQNNKFPPKKYFPAKKIFPAKNKIFSKKIFKGSVYIKKGR